MPNKHPIVDSDAAVAALNGLVDTINATGGVSPYYEDRPLEENTPTPVADEDWIDLAAAYALACRALGLPMQWAGLVECTHSTEQTEEQPKNFTGAEPAAAELEVPADERLENWVSILEALMMSFTTSRARLRRRLTIRGSMSKLLTGRRRDGQP